MSNRDHLYFEYEEVRKEMNGISPKLSTYARLSARLEELRKLINDNRPKAKIELKKPMKR